MSKRTSILVALILIAIVLGFLLAKREGKHESTEQTPVVQSESTTTKTTTTVSKGTGSFGTTNAVASYSVLDKSNDPVKVQPPVGLLARAPVGARPVTLERIKVLQAELTTNPNALTDWLELGVLYKSTGDYEGARLSWEYAGVIRPSNVISFANLGDLYQYYLKDFPKAEVVMNTALKNDPSAVDSYLRLFNLYSLSYKTETTLAAETLRKGIERNPDAVSLMITLGDYYKGKEAYPLAKTAYEQALVVAKKTNNSMQITEITSLLNKLP